MERHVIGLPSGELLYLLGADRLGLDRHHIVDQRHGRGAHIGVDIHRRAGPLHALVGEGVGVVVELGRAAVDQQLPLPQRIEAN